MREHLKNKIFIFAVIALTLIAVFLRFNRLGHYSFYSFDSATTSLAIKGILENGYPKLPSGNIYPRSLVYNYLTALLCYCYGLNEFSLRLISAISGVLIVILIFFIGRRFFPDYVAILSSLFMCFCLWAVEFSRYERFYALFQLFYFLAVYFFYNGFFENKKAYEYLFILAFLATLFTHLLGITLLSLFILLYILNGNKGTRGRPFIIFLILTVISLCWLFFETRWLNKIIASSPAIGRFSLPKPSFIYYFFKQFGLMAAVLFLGLIYIFYDTWLKRKNNQIIYMSWVFVIPLFSMSLINTHNEPRYNFFLLPFFVLLYFYLVFHLTQNYLRSKTLRFVAIIFFIGVSLYYAYPIKAIQVANRKYGEAINSLFSPSTYITYYPDHQSPAQFVKERLRSGDIIAAYGSTLNYYYLGRLDYVLVSGLHERLQAKRAIIHDPYTGVEMIYSLSQFKALLNNHKRIWVIKTGIYDGNRYSDLNRYFDRMSERIVYTGKDGSSKVYLF